MFKYIDKSVLNLKPSFWEYKNLRYLSIKSKYTKIWLDSNVFEENDFKKFKFELENSGFLKPSATYSVLLKARKNDQYLTLTNKQIGFNLNDDVKLNQLFETIKDNIDKLYEDYNHVIEGNFDAILLDFFEVVISEDLIKIPNLEKIEGEYISKKDLEIIKRDFNMFGDILSENKKDYEIKFNIECKDKKNYIKKNLDIKYYNINENELENYIKEFNNNISKNENNQENIEEISKYYVDNNSKYYLVTGKNNKKYINIYNQLEKNKIIKRCYNLNANLIKQVKEDKTSEDLVERKSGNHTIYINKNNEIVVRKREIKFTPINSFGVKRYNDIKSNKKSIDWLPNPNIGVLDIETYEDNGVSKPYAIGFKTNKDSDSSIYYIDKNLDSVELMHICINEMLRDKYYDVKFYAHNLGGFDAVFIIKNLLLYNERIEDKESLYKFDETNTIVRNSNVICLVIKRKINNKIRKLTLLDSFAILPRSLKDLCIDYDINHKKSYFPYKFCNSETLFYKGKTPDRSYYKGISESEYKNLYKEIWSMEKETKLYLELDILCLFDVIVLVNKGFHRLFGVQMTNNVTISSISIKLFMDKYYDIIKTPLPLITDRKIWEDIYQSYYGGRVEIFNPVLIDEIGYHYDVNSLYPFSSINNMPGLNCEYIEYFPSETKEKIVLKNSFGFFYCKIETYNNYLGLLPYRTKKGSLVFPTGKWSGWYFSEELKFAADNGYKIEIIRGYNFDKQEKVFTKFVSNIYEKKSNTTNKTERNLAKLILNSLIGKFGMDLFKPTSKLLDYNKHNLFLTTKILRNSIKIDENTYLDTYIPSTNKKVCEEFGVDYIKALNKDRVYEKKEFNSFVSISTAAATLSYARINMAKLFLHILKNNGKIFYTDTDSVVTNLNLSDKYVDSKELGKLKLENIIREAYYVADKTYIEKTENGGYVKKAKGIDSSRLTFEDYKSLYNMGNIENSIRVNSKRDYSLGSVVIKDEKVNLNVKKYNKRDMIFENGKWEKTKPIVIDNINK